MKQSDEDMAQEDPANNFSADELRWIWIRLGVRIVIGLLVVAATLLLIFTAR